MLDDLQILLFYDDKFYEHLFIEVDMVASNVS